MMIQHYLTASYKLDHNGILNKQLQYRVLCQRKRKELKMDNVALRLGTKKR